MTAKLLGIAGSLRTASYNRLLLSELAQHSPPLFELSVFDTLGAVPLFDEDVEDAGTPEGVQTLAAAVASARAVVFATPEYNQALPGVLKNAIDWLSRPSVGTPLRGKPVAVTGVTTGSWGTRLAQSQLRGTLIACGAWVMPTPVLFVPRVGAECWEQQAVTDFVEAISSDMRRLETSIPAQSSR